MRKSVCLCVQSRWCTNVVLQLGYTHKEGTYFLVILNIHIPIRIESESSNYRIWISGYSGNATDSLSAHNGSEFSTYDNDNDSAPKCCPCAPSYGGGWWFYR